MVGQFQEKGSPLTTEGQARRPTARRLRSHGHDIVALSRALAAPMALLLHLFALRSYLRSEATTPLRSARAAR